MTELMDNTLKIKLQRDCGFHPAILLLFSGSLTRMEVSCHAVSCSEENPLQQGTEGTVQATLSKELGLFV